MKLSKIVDGITKAELASLLKQHGFKKKTRNFYRENADRTDVINIQASQWNEGREGQFTVSVGICFPAISEIIDAPLIKGLPKEYDCTIRERIGLITEENRDIWWKINTETNQSVLANDLASKVNSICLP